MTISKVYLFISLYLVVGITTVLALPADLEPLPTWYPIGENELGIAYSTQPVKRDETSWYQIGESKHGAVYSSVDPTLTRRQDHPNDNLALEGYGQWISANTELLDPPTQRAPLQDDITKRDALAPFLVCMASCQGQLAQANSGPFDTIARRVAYCITYCVTLTGAHDAIKQLYLSRYGDQSFPPT